MRRGRGSGYSSRTDNTLDDASNALAAAMHEGGGMGDPVGGRNAYFRLLQRTSKDFASCCQTSDRRRASSAIS